MTGATRSRYMMVRRHKQMQAFNIVPTYATDAHYTTVARQDLWEELTHYNSTPRRSFPLPYIQQSIRVPLWAAGVYSLRDVSTADGVRITTERVLQQAFPAITLQQSVQALRRLAQLLCTEDPWQPGWEHTPPVLQEQPPQQRILPMLVRAPTPRQRKLLAMLRHVDSTATTHLDDPCRVQVTWRTSHNMRKPTLLRLLRLGCAATSVRLGTAALQPTVAAVDTSRARTFSVDWEPTLECKYHYTQGMAQRCAAAAAPLLDELRDACLDTHRPVPPYIPTSRVSLHTEEVNPDADIQPANAPSIYVADEKAWLYTAAGKCLTTLPLRTLRKLAACHASLEATYSDISAAICTAAQHHTQFFATTQRMTTEHPLPCGIASLPCSLQRLGCGRTGCPIPSPCTAQLDPRTSGSAAASGRSLVLSTCPMMMLQWRRPSSGRSFRHTPTPPPSWFACYRPLRQRPARSS